MYWTYGIMYDNVLRNLLEHGYVTFAEMLHNGIQRGIRPPEELSPSRNYGIAIQSAHRYYALDFTTVHLKMPASNEAFCLW